MKSTIVLIAFLITGACAASLNSRIVGGKIAEEGQFPYEVSIRLFGQHNCGGTIIADLFVLTAAHCVIKIPIQILTVVAGTNQLSVGGVSHKVAATHWHTQFSFEGTKYDVGLIKLATKLSFNSLVQPIQLNANLIPADSDLTLSGWGIESWPSQTPSERLKYLQLKAVGTEECKKRLEDVGYLGDEVDGSLICALKSYGEGACSGDSGSPLVFEGRIAGIASWVIPCAKGYPDVYTNVAEYIDWIQEHMI